MRRLIRLQLPMRKRMARFKIVPEKAPPKRGRKLALSAPGGTLQQPELSGKDPHRQFGCCCTRQAIASADLGRTQVSGDEAVRFGCAVHTGDRVGRFPACPSSLEGSPAVPRRFPRSTFLKQACQKCAICQGTVRGGISAYRHRLAVSSRNPSLNGLSLDACFS